MYILVCMYVRVWGPYDNNVLRRWSPSDCCTFEGHVQVVDAFTMRWKKIPSSERVSESSVLFFLLFVLEENKSKNIYPYQFLMSVCPIDAWGASDASLRSKVNWRKLDRVAVVLQLQGGRWSTSEAFSLEGHKYLLCSYAYGRPTFKVCENFCSASCLNSKQGVVLCCNNRPLGLQNRGIWVPNPLVRWRARCTQVAHVITS